MLRNLSLHGLQGHLSEVDEMMRKFDAEEARAAVRRNAASNYDHDVKDFMQRYKENPLYVPIPASLVRSLVGKRCLTLLPGSH